MTFTEIIAEVRDACRVPDTTAKTTVIRRQINLSMDDWSRYQPQWWTETPLTLTLAAGSWINLPSRFTCMDRRTMRTASDEVVWTDWSRVERADPDLSETGAPTNFSIVGKKWGFYPGLSASFVSSGALYCRHYQTMKLLATDGTSTASLYGDSDSPDPPIDLHEGVVLGAKARYFKLDGQLDKSKDARAEFVDFVKIGDRRGPVIGASYPVGDGGFSYLVA